MLFTVIIVIIIIIIIIIIIFFFFRSLYCPGLREATSSLRGGWGVEASHYLTGTEHFSKIYLFGFWFQFLHVYVTYQNYNVQFF